MNIIKIIVDNIEIYENIGKWRIHKISAIFAVAL